MSLLAFGRVLVAALVLAGAGAASAQTTRSPAPVRVAQQDDGQDGGGDPAGLVLRLGRMEEQIRSLTGQVEQLQFQNRKLEETLRKAQADNDFRFKDLEGGAAGGGAAAPRPSSAPARRSDAEEALPSAAPAAAALPAAMPAARVATRRPSDAFDPASDPAAPGAPRPLGTTTPSQPLPARTSRTADNRGGPLDLTRPQSPTTPAAAVPDDVPGSGPAATLPVTRDPGSVASLAPGGTREEYDADLGLYRQGTYDGAASGFKAFATKYPKDRLVPDAVFLAGESYARLGRHSEAVEQFLRVFTDYGKSPRAPDALLRLGISLNALGQREQACATYQEVTRRFPSASTDVRSAVDRELKKARCTANG